MKSKREKIAEVKRLIRVKTRHEKSLKLAMEQWRRAFDDVTKKSLAVDKLEKLIEHTQLDIKELTDSAYNEQK